MRGATRDRTRGGTGWRGVTATLSLLLLAACATQAPEETVVVTPPPPPPPPVEEPLVPRIVDTGEALWCVDYARLVTDFDLQGDAGTWWDAAAGRYDRGLEPQEGSLLIFKSTPTSVGHVAVVVRVVDDRQIVASHANWLNDRLVHENTPIKDVSPMGDWSSVRVWYIPGNTWGRTTYQTYGFVYDRKLLAADGG